MQRDEPRLHVRPDAHLPGAPEQHPDPTLAHGLEESCLGDIALVVVDEGNLG